MQRRRYLALAAVSLGSAGCVSELRGDGGSQSGASPTDTGFPTRLSTDSTTVRLSEPRARASVVAVGTSGVHLGVHDAPGTQYLVLVASRDGGSISDLPLSVVDDATVADSFRFVGRSNRADHARLAFPVPVEPYDRVAVELGSGDDADRAALPESVTACLRHAPDFRVTEFSVPDSVTYGESFEASFVVANGGDREGRFLAEFGNRQVSDTGEVSLTVPVDESRSHSDRIEPYYEDIDADSVPVVLDWGLKRRVQQVEVTGGPSPTPTRSSATPSADSG